MENDEKFFPFATFLDCTVAIVFSQKAYLHFRENVCFSGQNIPSTVLCLLRWNRCNLVAHPYHSVFVIQKEIYPPEEECYVRLTFLTTFVELELSLNFSFFVVND